MLKIFIEPLLHIAVILPFLLCLKNRGRINNLRILSITFCYYIYSIALLLPKLFDVCNFINSRWNWDGKIFGIICCVLLYLIFRKLFSDNDFFTFKQSKDGLKPAALGAAIVVLISAVIWAILGNTQFNIESLLFQISLPGIDEELMFRGLILGLMCSSLRTIQSSFGNTAIILNAVLFGLMHALTLTSDSINFNFIYFLQTGSAGYIWAWITLKSKSILLAIIYHNFSNFFGTLATMLK